MTIFFNAVKVFTCRLDAIIRNSLLALIFSSVFNITHCYAAVSVGDSYGGGTVFCVSQTPDITQCVPQGSGNYGLIMANEDQANFDSNPKHGVSWASKYDAIPSARSDDDGAANTAAIIAASPQDNPSNNAAWLCHNYRDKAEGWYLPSKNELNKMYLFAKANNLIGKGCAGRKAGGAQCLLGGYDEYMRYWSSTEYSGNYRHAWLQNFSYGGQYCGSKVSGCFGVRAVRAFINSTIQPFNNLPKPKVPHGVAVAVVAKDPTSNATAPAVAPQVVVAPVAVFSPAAAPAAAPKQNPLPQAAYPTVPIAAAASAPTGADRFTFAVVGDKLARLGDLNRLFPPSYQVPTLIQAMVDAGVPSSEKVSAVCDDVAACAIADGTVNCTRLTQEDVAAIAMYTFDFGNTNRDRNPYRLINGGLFDRDTLQLRGLRGVIYRLLRALRNVQPVRPPALFRGIREHVRLDDAHYHKGNKIMWHTFSSTTTDMQTTQNFLTDPATGRPEGTLFIIHGTPWGYNIKPFSCFPDEEEILLEPEIELRVTGVINAPLVVVDLEMLPDQRLLLESLIPRNAGGVASPAPAPAPSATAQYRRYVALADWESTIAGGLSFRRGDAINIIDDKNEWWTGELNGKRGFVPPGYLRPELPPPGFPQ